MLLGALLLLPPGQRGHADVPPPSLREVLELVEANLEGASTGQIEQFALHGLIEQLAPRLQLLDPREASPAAEDLAVGITAAERVGKGLAYLRLANLGPGVAAAVEAQLTAWVQESPPQGLVLDLRFAGGTDYAEAGRVAGLFLTDPVPLLDAGQGMQTRGTGDRAFTAPVVVLLNRRTSGAAEVLAAVLRQTEVGLTLGGQTAGQAHLFEEFPLSNGQRLRIATGRIRLGDGQPFPAGGLPADLPISVPLTDEEQYLEQTGELFRARTAALEAGRSNRLTEADLVLVHREGPGAMTNVTAAITAGTGVRLTDPTLERALDLLTGLTVVRDPTRP